MRPAMRTSLAIGLVAGTCGWPATVAYAQPPVDGDASTPPLDVITVVAHRQPRTSSEVAGTVTVMDALRLERDLVVDVADLGRYETGLEVDDGGTRFGSGGFRIRGIGGNRTVVVIDEVPVADRFSVGNFADSGRGLMQLGLVETVEVLRGPASTLYGSKALGGVVSMRLIEPADLLRGADRGSRVGVAGGSDRDLLRLLAAAARDLESWQVMGAVAGQRSGKVDVPKRPAGLRADDLDRREVAGLLRAVRDTPLGPLRLTAMGMHEDRESDLFAVLGTDRFANTTALAGDDRRRHGRLQLDQQLNALGPVARGHWRLWYQLTDSRQETLEERTLAPVPVALYRRFDLRQETVGIGADLESVLRAGDWRHRIGYGFELVHSDLTQRRDGRQTDLATGRTTTTLLGENFPLRDFPRTEVTELGVYLHDEIRPWPGGPMFSPGLRFEYYRLDGSADALFRDAFPGAEVTNLTTTAWTPRLGVIWPLWPNLDLFGQYARGFRSPPFEDVNIGLDIPRFDIRAIPNPDLKPERGHAWEAGLRWRSRVNSVEVAAFRNDYRNFIETRAALGPDPRTGTLLFQSVNRDRVRIEGVELRAWQDLGGRFEVELSGEWLRGQDRGSGRNLPTTPPPQAILALEYSPADAWALRWVTTITRSQKALEDGAGNPLFSPSGHMVTDLIARFAPTRQLRMTVGVFNLTDRRFWRNARVSGRRADDPTLPLLAEAGRHVLFRVDWQQ